MITIHEAADVNAEVLAAAEETEGWFYGARIDWDLFWDKLDEVGYFVEQMDSPAALKIQRHVRELRKAS